MERCINILLQGHLYTHLHHIKGEINDFALSTEYLKSSESKVIHITPSLQKVYL